MKRFSAPALLMFLLPVSAFAVPLELHYGANSVDINGDGVPDLIVKTRWENMNAHSFDKYLVAIHLKDKFYDREYYEVPLGDTFDYSFANFESADCLNKDIISQIDYKFELDKGWLKVTRYERIGWDDHSDVYPVKIMTYRLTDSGKEGERGVGDPLFYLKLVDTQMARKKYCDVKDLMK
jgi:hypothetical protein